MAFHIPVVQLNVKKQVSAVYKKLYLSSQMSDVTFVVEGEHLPAHRVLLANKSDYFKAMFCGGMREATQKVIELKDVNKTAFKKLLKFFYTGRLSFLNVKTEFLVRVLSLCRQYLIEDLEEAFNTFLRNNINEKNVCGLFELSRIYHQDVLRQLTQNYMNENTGLIMKQDSFKNLSAEALLDIIDDSLFCAPEVEIFWAVHRWAQSNPELDSSIAYKGVRLHLIAESDLLKVIKPTGAYPEDVILVTADEIKNDKTKIRHRGILAPEANVAAATFGAAVTHGLMPSCMLDENSVDYDSIRGFTRHYIRDSDNGIIIVRLRKNFIINHIKMLLWDKHRKSSYAYYIEVSMDQKFWVRVVDYTSCFCRSWQYLYFPEQTAKFIKIVGTNSLHLDTFDVVSFEAMYTHHNVELMDGIIVAKDNVATIDKGAIVHNGIAPQYLLNGDTINYDRSSGFTYHALPGKHEGIIVQLNQPYMLSSIRFLLWDKDRRYYSYKIGTSTNGDNGLIVADRSSSQCESWQVHRFYPRPVVFITILGTYNSANNFFHIVHFECPSQEQESQRKSLKARPHQRNIEGNSLDTPPTAGCSHQNYETITL